MDNGDANENNAVKQDGSNDRQICEEEQELYEHMHDQEEYLSSGYSTISSGSDQDELIQF